jgi:hypothetical protein
MKTQKTYLYFLKDINEGSYWDGSYKYELSQQFSDNHPNKHLKVGFNNVPRLFKTPASLLTSFRLLPKKFHEDFIKENPEPKETYLYNEKNEKHGRTKAYWDWIANKTKAAIAFKKEYTSLEILKMFESQGYFVYKLELGKTLKSAKSI